MRVGLGVSIIGHLAILGIGFVTFPAARPFAPTATEALPVDLVPVSELTDLRAGDKSAEAAPQTPQPKQQVKAEAPAPKPAEKPAEKPVEAPKPPPPPPPPPEPAPPEPTPPEPAPPEPAPEPAPPEPPEPPEPAPPPPQAAQTSEPETPAPLPPAQRLPVQPNLPRSRPNPPRQVAEAKPPEAQPDRKEQDRLRDLSKARPEKDFSTDDIAALLDKREPAGGGDPQPALEPQTLGSVDGKAEAEMTQSELAALQARLYQCWAPPVGVREAGGLVVTVRIDLSQDGQLSKPPQIVSVDRVSDPLARVAAEAAIRAVVQCAPFGDILRPEKYALWHQIDFVFDPRLMLGG